MMRLQVCKVATRTLQLRLLCIFRAVISARRRRDGSSKTRCSASYVRRQSEMCHVHGAVCSTSNGRSASQSILQDCAVECFEQVQTVSKCKGTACRPPASTTSVQLASKSGLHKAKRHVPPAATPFQPSLQPIPGSTQL